MKEGRLLVLTPFDRSVRRTTAAQAVRRNDLVAALADAVWTPHASPGGKTWATILAALKRGQPVYAFDLEENGKILIAGARRFEEFSVDAFRLDDGKDIAWP